MQLDIFISLGEQVASHKVVTTLRVQMRVWTGEFWLAVLCALNGQANQKIWMQSVD